MRGRPGCARCGGTGVLKPGKHPAAVRAKEILDVKFAAKEVELYEKLLLAGKFHASFVVIGTLSSRMAGADGLNPQGIKHTKDVRRMFPLSWDGISLCGGDFDSFEVTIADAVYNDPALRAELITGRKIHALFGMAIFPGMTYEEVKSSDGSTTNRYVHKGKQGVFGRVYGGDWNTLVKSLGVTEEVAKGAMRTSAADSPASRSGGSESRRLLLHEATRRHRLEGGLGRPGRVHRNLPWLPPLLHPGKQICKALFDLARNLPKHWRDCKVKVVRRDRVQTAGGAVSSALYGAAFQMQAANMRAAANHEIQSPGAEITKSVQRTIWDLQPAGVNDW